MAWVGMGVMLIYGLDEITKLCRSSSSPVLVCVFPFFSNKFTYWNINMLKQNFQFEFQNGPNVIHFKGGGDGWVGDKEKLQNAPGENFMPLEIKKKIPHPGTNFWRAGSHPVRATFPDSKIAQKYSCARTKTTF